MIWAVLGIFAWVGFAIMLCSYIERPTNNSGSAGDGFVSGRRTWHPRWPPENERLSHSYRRWWEL